MLGVLGSDRDLPKNGGMLHCKSASSLLAKCPVLEHTAAGQGDPMALYHDAFVGSSVLAAGRYGSA